MHFMIGRIFMNQESKVINVHLEKRENKDYLVFGFEEVAEVCLNDDESQNNLKSIFVKLLTEITKYPIELQFLEKLVDCLEKCLICRHIRRFAD